jgi:hypothetical protein
MPLRGIPADEIRAIFRAVRQLHCRMRPAEVTAHASYNTGSGQGAASSPDEQLTDPGDNRSSQPAARSPELYDAARRTKNCLNM